MHIGNLPVVTPFPWPHLLTYVSHRLIAEAERIEAGRYLRREGKRTITVSYDEKAACLQVVADGRVKTNDVLRRVGALFDVHHDCTSVARDLSRSSVLASRIAAVPGMRPVGAWSAFELCARTILGQQVSVAGAGTLMRRLVQRCGVIEPQCVIDADLADMGMPGKRVESIRALARAVTEGRVVFDQPWTKLEAQLRQLPGFGPWTRMYLAIRLGRDSDAFPETDLGLIRAAGADSPAALLKLAEQWRPWRAYAATYLWAVQAID